MNENLRVAVNEEDGDEFPFETEPDEIDMDRVRNLGREDVE